MKTKLLLLPLLISTLIACGNDDDNIKVPNTPTTPTTPTNPTTPDRTNGDLLEPGAKGDITTFGGAARLKADRTEALKASLSNKQVKHVILFIGDGTSESEITAARNYAEGAAGYFKGLDVFPFTGAYTTYALDEKNKTVDYVTDSAASATAWASGVKTYNNALGIDAFGKRHATILELAKQAGFATGNVTTTELQDATPAALISHISYRSCYGPVATAAKCPTYSLDLGGLGSITEQLLQTRADVTFGGGRATFERETATAGAYKGKTLLEQAKAMNYNIITTASELNGVTVANQNSPVLGLFHTGNLPVLWAGPAAKVNGNKEAATTCYPNPARDATIPALKDMTSKAIDLLKVNPKGFFLQVESGSIDKRNHASDACGQIGETVAFDEAIQVALEFAKKNPDTLIIVTGDHAHTSQIIPNDANSPGRTVKLRTKDNADMTINYGTSTGSSQEHTGAQVRTAAYGPRAANISGLLDQTDLFFIMRDAMGLK
ncbi:alkaline phosphatase [Acinetobacter sp. ANC 4558]|uniref:alkaline phosphatase n=1 Tax=Acinetobacter sp. ANC 4558 TaxID=1977876 RepID=UPI000A33B64A|nr:alkaline phosphatase [Acinetobacter sp. ANC 4558]OTG86439.1 alkaline phosphatase [Acinetobacter sp. ANC 4558]